LLGTVATSAAITDLLARSWNRPSHPANCSGSSPPGITAPRAVEDAGEAIGRCIASMVILFDPERVVVGGELAIAGETLLEPLRHSISAP